MRTFAMVIAATLGLAMLPTQAQARVCLQKLTYRGCVAKNSGLNGKENPFEYCRKQVLEKLKDCKDKKECKKDCKDEKKDAKDACKEDYLAKTYTCDGVTAKECKELRKKAMKDCKKELKETFRDCKKACKDK